MKLANPPLNIGNPNQFGEHACKICNCVTEPFDVTDFNKNCELANNQIVNLAGIPVYYNFCTNCGFLFTTFCDGWDADSFRKYIYNDEYETVDPNYTLNRPREWADHFHALFRTVGNPDIRVLDYGCGNGEMARLMRDREIHTVGYDPFYHPVKPAEQFDTITCCEVIEHAHDPVALLADMVSLLKDDGNIVFTTVLIPPDIRQIGTRWWYAAPRNGHVSMFSLSSLMLLGDKFELDLHIGQINGAEVKCFAHRAKAS